MPTCFVAMGFGKKTDFLSNPPRVLDLDRTFEDIIGPTVADAGLDCVRADKIIHSTVIDKPMYEHLLNADVVIADLSTSNANAIYELGVRHALRPTTTIVMAEENFTFPFDFNHLSILKYKHLGEEIGFREVNRVKAILKEKLVELVQRREVDSPVYLFLPTLARPELTAALAAAAPPPAESSAPKDASSFAELMKNFQDAKAAVSKPYEWMQPIAFLNRLRTMQPQDPYILQQLALATYKSKLPDTVTALQNAKAILEDLSPRTTADPETLGLWGAVHKRLWEETKDRGALDESITAYQRGFVVKSDYYNGVNYAFMLNVRASISKDDDAVTDRTTARRVRTQVLEICDEKLKPPGPSADEHFWVDATKVEALLGLGRNEESDALKTNAIKDETERLKAAGKDPKEIGWKSASLFEQLEKLAGLLGAGPKPGG